MHEIIIKDLNVIDRAGRDFTKAKIDIPHSIYYLEYGNLGEFDNFVVKVDKIVGCIKNVHINSSNIIVGEYETINTPLSYQYENKDNYINACFVGILNSNNSSIVDEASLIKIKLLPITEITNEL